MNSSIINHDFLIRLCNLVKNIPIQQIAMNQNSYKISVRFQYILDDNIEEYNRISQLIHNFDDYVCEIAGNVVNNVLFVSVSYDMQDP